MQNHYEPFGDSALYLLLLGRNLNIHVILAQKNLKFKEVVLKRGNILEDIKMANDTVKKPRSKRKKKEMAGEGAARVRPKGAARGRGDDRVSGSGIRHQCRHHLGPAQPERTDVSWGLASSAALRIEDVHGALGWLGREDKIDVKKKGRSRIYSLKP